MFSSGSEIVDEMGKINMNGNVIPHSWYSQLIKETDKGTKKPYLNAIIILAEIAYWYRPSLVMNEEGLMVGYKKKFKQDILQKSYSQLRIKTGLSEKAIRDAIVYLEEKGVIKRELRTVKSTNSVLYNVMHIHLIISKFVEITFPPLEGIPQVYEKIGGPLQKNRDTPIKKEGGAYKNIGTYTQNTTHITTQVSSEEEEEYIIKEAGSSRNPEVQVDEEHEEKIKIVYKYLQESNVGLKHLKIIIKFFNQNKELLIGKYIVQQHEACIAKEGLYDYSKYFTNGLVERVASQHGLQKIETRKEFQKVFDYSPPVPIEGLLHNYTENL